MNYSDHFKSTDNLIRHLDAVFTTLQDPFIESHYTGFLAVSGVTVFELSIKTIFCNFAESKHPVLGCFCSQYFDRINGKIRIKDIKDEYIPRFGDKYKKRFDRKLEAIEKLELSCHGISIKSSYGNLITWRNSFAHEGIVPSNASYGEVKTAYNCGKQIMNCLAESMRY